VPIESTMFKLLIIENDNKLRRRIKAILELRLPFVKITEASSSEEALILIEQHKPEFILMDICLKKENGLDLVKKIKYVCPHTVITINSNCDSPEYRAEAVHKGADYFLSKTTNTIQDLFELVESIHSEKFGNLRKNSSFSSLR
jgi:two-component system response regulator YesN